MRSPSVTPPAATVLVVEDHPDYRDVLTRTLASSSLVKAVHVCRDLPAAQSWLEKSKPDLLLIDLGLPSGSGHVLIRQAQRRYGKSCATAVLTMTGDIEDLMKAIGAGAKGYLFKSDTTEQWLDCVDLLLNAQSPLQARMAQAMLAALSQSGINQRAPVNGTDKAILQHIASGYLLSEVAEKLLISRDEVGLRIRTFYDQLLQPVPYLTVRELELLDLLNRGMTFKQCASHMGIGEATIKTHASRAYEKLGASNLQMALYEARQAGLLS